MKTRSNTKTIQLLANVRRPTMRPTVEKPKIVARIGIIDQVLVDIYTHGMYRTE